ncbi:MAG: amino acid ABC transporter [Clostridiales bacterium GWB2_37_7]|nr:MAG: amino acid ABC transporter [Clostridiales bacterium GWB2_37_7]
MKNNVKKVLTVLLILAMVLSFAACSAKPAGEVAPAEEQKAAATKLEQIKAKGKIVLGTSADYPPYEFHKSINGKDEIVGFDIEIAKTIAKDLGVELEIKDMKFDGLLAALVVDDIDFIVAGMVPKEERKQSVDFSMQYYQADQNVLIRAEDADKITSIEALKGLKVGAQKSTVQEDLAKEKTEAAEVKSLSKITDLVLELQNGKIDAVVLVGPVANAYAKQNAKLAVSGISLGAEEGVAIAVNKGTPDLLESINKSLDTMIKAGAIDKFIEEATLLSEQE